MPNSPAGSSQLTRSANDAFAAELRGFGPIGLLAILLIAAGNYVFVPLSGLLVLAWVWRSHTPWRDIGYERPRGWVATIAIGIGEETVFRGYMFERLGKLLGRGSWVPPVIILVSTLWFGLLHYPVQGIGGAQQATIVGLVFGTILAITGKIWMLMFAHAAFDLTAVAIIYWNVENQVARFLFKYPP